MQRATVEGYAECRTRCLEPNETDMFIFTNRISFFGTDLPLFTVRGRHHFILANGPNAYGLVGRVSARRGPEMCNRNGRPLKAGFVGESHALVPLAIAARQGK